MFIYHYIPQLPEASLPVQRADSQHEGIGLDMRTEERRPTAGEAVRFVPLQCILNVFKKYLKMKFSFSGFKYNYSLSFNVSTTATTLWVPI